MTENAQAIALEAVLSKISTTVDGGWNLTFSVSESESSALMELSKLRDVNLGLAIVPITGE